MKQIWTVTPEVDGDDMILPLPDDMIKTLGWQQGDIIDWSIEDGKVIAKRMPSQAVVDECTKIIDGYIPVAETTEQIDAIHQYRNDIIMAIYRRFT